MFRIMTKMNIVMTTSTPNNAAENEDVNNSPMLVTKIRSLKRVTLLNQGRQPEVYEQFSYLTCLQTTTFILLRISLLVEKINLKA